ncbi:hypothetical protein B6V01_001640 [Methanosarcinales archaeon ex4572_44]|nr:MAG: hypothetical protein B6U67_01460 [Methanosarcinales archaeon ex4484_138]PHP45920.1 MAG: hypothetical protein B6V01_001640 [Methanosarcinales archaeon ex4572_44]
MVFIEKLVGILSFTLLYLWHINRVTLILFLITLILLIFLYYVCVRNSSLVPNLINHLLKGSSHNRKKHAMEKMQHYHELSRTPRIAPVLIPLAVTIFVAYIILNKYIFLAIVTSGSMAPTLEVTDMVFMQSLQIDPEEGEIIMFDVKEVNMPVIHRIQSIIDGRIKTKGDAAQFTDDWTLKEKEIKGEAVMFKGKPIIVKGIGEYLLFNPEKTKITRYGSEMYKMSQIVQGVKRLGLTIFIICILLYVLSATSSKR